MPVETSQPDDQAWQFSYFAAARVLPGRPSDAKLHERHASPELRTTTSDIARAPSRCFISVQETFHFLSSYTLHKKLGTGGAAGVLSLVSFPPTFTYHHGGQAHTRRFRGVLPCACGNKVDSWQWSYLVTCQLCRLRPLHNTGPSARIPRRVPIYTERSAPKPPGSFS